MKITGDRIRKWIWFQVDNLKKNRLNKWFYTIHRIYEQQISES